MKVSFFIQTRIGDTLFATPAIKAIFANFNEPSIDVFTNKNGALLYKNTFLRRSIRINNTLAKLYYFLFWAFPKYDLAFVFIPKDTVTNLASRLSKKVFCLHYTTKKNWSNVIIAPERKNARQHAIHTILNVISLAGIETNDFRITYRPTDKESQWAEQKIKKLLTKFPADSRTIIAMQTTSFYKKSYRNWPEESYAELITLILNNHPSSAILLIGSKDKNETKKNANLSMINQTRIVNLTGKTNLRQTGAILSKVDLYIGLDSGPTHIASAFDIKIVSLFHCISTHSQTGAIGHPQELYFDLLPTTTCTERTPMSLIPVDKIASAVDKILRKNP